MVELETQEKESRGFQVLAVVREKLVRVRKMFEEGVGCPEILQQILSVQKSLGLLQAIVFEEQIRKDLRTDSGPAERKREEIIAEIEAMIDAWLVSSPSASTVPPADE